MTILRPISHNNFSRCEFTKKVYKYEIFYNKIYSAFIISVLIHLLVISFTKSIRLLWACMILNV